MAITRSNLIHSFKTLTLRLNESDLKTLCFYLGVDYEDVHGEGKNDKIRELLIYLERHGRLADLIREGKSIRSDIPWDDLLEKEIAPPVQIECLPGYPYNHFASDFREVIAPLCFQSTGSVMNIVFGNIAKVEHTTVVAPINQSFDFLQRGPKSVLASFERIIVNGQPFFDSLEAIWPERERPKNAGIGHSHFVRLPQNSQSLYGVMFVVTTRNLSSKPAHYGRYVDTPLEGIDYVLDNVLREARDESVGSLALPLLGTGYANINRTLTPQISLLMRKIVTGLSIRKVEDCLTDRQGKLRRGVVVLYSSQPNSQEEHQLWEFVIKFVKADPQTRVHQLEKLTQDLQELNV